MIRRLALSHNTNDSGIASTASRRRAPSSPSSASRLRSSVMSMAAPVSTGTSSSSRMTRPRRANHSQPLSGMGQTQRHGEIAAARTDMLAQPVIKIVVGMQQLAHLPVGHRAVARRKPEQLIERRRPVQLAARHMPRQERHAPLAQQFPRAPEGVGGAGCSFSPAS